MSRRPTLRELDYQILTRYLDDTWRTPTDFQRILGLGGSDWYKIALTLERAVNDGYAELKSPGSKVRRFRRREPNA